MMMRAILFDHKAMAQINAVFISLLHQILAALLQLSVVSGVSDGFGHHRGVHNDFIGDARFEHTTAVHGINGHHLQF
jgi:hypothetical protein